MTCPEARLELGSTSLGSVGPTLPSPTPLAGPREARVSTLACHSPGAWAWQHTFRKAQPEVAVPCAELGVSPGKWGAGRERARTRSSTCCGAGR